MDTLGKHLLVEVKGCLFDRVNDMALVETLMKEAAIEAKCHILHSHFHPFEPQGITGVVLLSESHISCHFFPEAGYGAVDFFTCGKGDPHAAVEVIRRGLRPTSIEVLETNRGLLEYPHSIKVTRHYSTELDKFASAAR